MKDDRFILRASITAALLFTSPWLFAADVGVSEVELAAFQTTEAPRVTQTVNNMSVSVIPHSRPASLAQANATGSVSDALKLNHMQLVLQPSANRQSQLEALIAQQHDRSSVHFHRWITPEQYGRKFGVLDSDIAASVAWLTSQGFQVNGIYPNKQQIDFTGNVAQIRQSFHTQEQYYDIDGVKHIANSTEISVPNALKPVLAGVVGLNDLRPKAMRTPEKIGQWNAQSHRFDPVNMPTPSGKAPPAAVPLQNGTRGLVPDDFNKMYGISTIRNNGVTGKGITIAVVEDGVMGTDDWNNFVSQFNLGSFGGTYTQVQPNIGDFGNCLAPFSTQLGSEDFEVVLDTEYATAIAPGANIIDASCYDAWEISGVDGGPTGLPSTSPNVFIGVFIAAYNLVNAPSGRPDIISASYGLGEGSTDATSKAEIDAMWAQADAEGISVFVSSGDSGSNPSFNQSVINGAGVDANSLATSPHATAVGGTDTADVLDGTTGKYFSKTPNTAYGTALGYVPEIPWNESCGNGVAALASGYSSAPAFCQFLVSLDPEAFYVTSEASSGGPSSSDRKPAWQRQIFNAAKDQSRDTPDVALFGGSYGSATDVILCTTKYPCTPGFSSPVVLEAGTSLSAPMFAGIQALIDQGLVMRGLAADQGNAAPTLYALAEEEYGNSSGTPPATLAACNSVDGGDPNAAATCVFHNITRGSISSECFQDTAEGIYTPNCYFVGNAGADQIGLTSLSTTQYGPDSKAYSARPGWSFASGLGSVNATNLLIAWRAFDNAPSSAPSVIH